jgi:hypothetical protein
MIHEENGQIIVDELRPMSEAPTEERSEMLVKMKNSNKLNFAVVFQGQLIDQCIDWIDPKETEGWIPMPICRPKDGA